MNTDQHVDQKILQPRNTDPAYISCTFYILCLIIVHELEQLKDGEHALFCSASLRLGGFKGLFVDTKFSSESANVTEQGSCYSSPVFQTDSNG